MIWLVDHVAWIAGAAVLCGLTSALLFLWALMPEADE